MLKVISVENEDATGRLFARVIKPGVDLVKEASAEIAPEIKKCADGLKAQKDKVYILVNALGAGEYYGSNYNGDYFEEAELDPSSFVGKPVTDYGYSTFLSSGVFRNHSNKERSKSYGTVICAAYNKAMHRVELVIEIDRKLCVEHGHLDLFDRLERGEKPSVSMGCRVKHDICSICGHASATRADYCEHTKNQLGQVLPDGRKVYVKNPKPVFFDISIVVIGADRTSYVMAKVARQGGYVTSSAEAAEDAGLVDPVERFRSLVKQSAKGKQAEISKQIQATAARVMPTLEGREVGIPKGVLDGMASSGDLGKALTTSAAAGILLRPQEFQRVVLVMMGMPGRADSLDRSCSCFKPSTSVDRSVPLGSPSDFDHGILSMLRPLIEGRSFFEPHITRRMVVIKTAARQTVNYVSDPVLEKIAAAYNGYREQLAERITEIVANITDRELSLSSTVRGGLLEDVLSGRVLATKTASATVPMALLGAVPLAYVLGAHTGGAKDEKTADSFVAKHPVLAISVLAGLARLVARAEENGQLDKALTKLVRH